MLRFFGDLRFALRVFAKNPGTTAVAVLSLALAIGPNSALFSVVDRMLLKPPPVERIERVFDVVARTDRQGVWDTPSYPDLEQYRTELGALADFAASERRGVRLSVDGTQQLVGRTIVTENYFSMLGIRPAAGRVLRESDAHFEGPPPAIISYLLWQRKFGGSPDAIGKTVLLNDRPYYVAGVAPRGFVGTNPLNPMPPDVWVTFTAAAATNRGEQALLTDRRMKLNVAARLRDGVDEQRAEAAFTEVARRLAREYPATNKAQSVVLVPIYEKGKRLLGVIVLALVGLVLLIACANVAGIFLAQGEARQREFAVRLALGARRGRLVRQLLAESLVLSAAAAAAGLLMAWWLIRALPAIQMPLPVSVDYDLRLDGRVAAYTVLLSLITAIAAGLVPALRASRPDLTPVLKGEAAAGRGRFRFRQVLIVTQIAVSQFLLVGAGLLVRSYLEARAVRPGFDPARNVLVAMVGPVREGAKIDFPGLLASLRATPGVSRVTSVRAMQLSGSGHSPQTVTAGPESLEVDNTPAGAEYFGVMGTRLLRGRDFRESDGEVAVVNETLARRLWGSPDAAMGRFVRLGTRDLQVVGVAENGKYHWLVEEPQPYLWRFSKGEGYLIIETAGPPGSVAGSVRAGLRDSRFGLQLLNMVTLREHMRLALFGWQMGAGLLGIMAVLGVFLAGVGLYGLVSYGVHRRSHEIGVRMAMGAGASDILKLVLRQSLVTVAVGAAVGVALAMGVAKIVAAILFGVSPADPVGVLAAVAAVLVVALLAAVKPARRAVRVDPMTVLRWE